MRQRRRQPRESMRTISARRLLAVQKRNSNTTPYQIQRQLVGREKGSRTIGFTQN